MCPDKLNHVSRLCKPDLTKSVKWYIRILLTYFGNNVGSRIANFIDLTYRLQECQLVRSHINRAFQCGELTSSIVMVRNSSPNSDLYVWSLSPTELNNYAVKDTRMSRHNGLVSCMSLAKVWQKIDRRQSVCECLHRHFLSRQTSVRPVGFVIPLMGLIQMECTNDKSSRTIRLTWMVYWTGCQLCLSNHESPVGSFNLRLSN